MADRLRARLLPLHTHHIRNASTNTIDSDSSDSSPGAELDDNDEDFVMLTPGANSSLSALTTVQDYDLDIDIDYLHRTSPVQKLPPELLIQIFSKLTTTSDVRNCMLVCYHWAQVAVGTLWHRPLCSRWINLQNVANALTSPHPSFPYHEMVKRLNLSAIADKVNDGTVLAFSNCKAVERLTLTSCIKLTDQGLEGLVDGTKRLQALDVTDLEALTDRSMLKVAQNCPKLQGLNITNCSLITDESLSQIAANCHQLKRLKLNGVSKATDTSIVAVAQNCRSILEIDLAGCQSISSASVTALLEHLPHLRELRLAHCVGIDNRAFTSLQPGLKFDALRILDLTACDGVGDEAISRIIPAAPRLRNLVLAKCRHITDAAVRAICTLTKNLHYIHLGHCHMLTDSAVIDLVTQCNRIRYIDLACCSRLTDASVRHLAKLPKLRRVGLVKCQNLTDASIIALARGPYGSSSSSTKPGMPSQFVSLERVHLSYCTSLTLKGITQLLLNCPRLTHLSLTGVQSFLRDDLTRFCREAPSEFTHVQRDVFCVFSGEGVARLRDYLLRLAVEEQERDQQQQNAVDEPVVGPDSSEADSMSDGTIDGNDQTVDFVYGPGRHGTVRMTNARPSRPRTRSLHDLSDPTFHIDMPLLPSDQMQRIGPWTPALPLTPEMSAQRMPTHLDSSNNDQSSSFPGRTVMNHGPSPLPTPALRIPSSDNFPRSRSQSRRHTMEDGFFGSQTRSYYAEPSSSRPFPPESGVFSVDHVALPIFHPSPRDQTGPAMDITFPLQTQQGSRTLRPDPTVNCFDLNYDSILSTVPTSRGPSRVPSRSNSPSLSRVQSRSRFGNFFANVRSASISSFQGEPSGTRRSENSQERIVDNQRQQTELHFPRRTQTTMSFEEMNQHLYQGDFTSSVQIRRGSERGFENQQSQSDLRLPRRAQTGTTFEEQNQHLHEGEGTPSSSQLPRLEFPNLPRDLMERIDMQSPVTPMETLPEQVRRFSAFTNNTRHFQGGNNGQSHGFDMA